MRIEFKNFMRTILSPRLSDFLRNSTIHFRMFLCLVTCFLRVTVSCLDQSQARTILSPFTNYVRIHWNMYRWYSVWPTIVHWYTTLTTSPVIPHYTPSLPLLTLGSSPLHEWESHANRPLPSMGAAPARRLLQQEVRTERWEPTRERYLNHKTITGCLNREACLSRHHEVAQQ